MAEEKVTKTDLAKVSTKIDAVANVVDDVKHKTKNIQKSVDTKSEDWDMMVEIKAEEIKTQAMFSELIGHLDQWKRDIKEEVKISEDRIKNELHAVLDKKKVIKLVPWSIKWPWQK